RAKGVAAAVVLEDAGAVQPVLDVGPARDDARGIPSSDGARRLAGRGRDQVVERGERPVAVAAELRVGVERVVQELEFAADRGAGGGRLAARSDRMEVGLDEVLDATVGARREAEVDAQLEVGEAVAGEEVAAGGGLGRGAGSRLGRGGFRSEEHTSEL